MPEFVSPHIRDLIPYKPGKSIESLAREKNISRIVKLASNENPLGISPKAKEAILKHLDNVFRYPDPQARSLVKAIAKEHQRRESEIICAHGSDALLSYMIHTFTSPRDEILTSEGTFIGVYVSGQKYGCTFSLVPMKNYHYDLDGISRAISEKTKIIYLANPNNPTGTMFKDKEFLAFMKCVPKDVLVILDEAYTLYASDYLNYPNGVDFAFENLLILRTLSKSHGLAGLRVGYAVGPENLVQELRKVKLPFEPNTLAQVAAIAALEDRDFLERTRKLNRLSLEQFRKKFLEWGVSFVPTSANFYLIIFSSEQEAKDFSENCLNEGLIVRHVKSFGIPNGVRINSGTIEETQFALGVIEKIYKQVTHQTVLQRGK